MKNKIFRDTVFVLFHTLVMAYAVILFFGATVIIVRAQEYRNRDYRLESVEKRIADIDSLKLDQRLIRIETILAGLEDHSWLANLTSGGVGLLLAKAVYTAAKNRSFDD